MTSQTHMELRIKEMIPDQQHTQCDVFVYLTKEDFKSRKYKSRE